MKRIILLTVLLVATSYSFAQTINNEVVIVKTYEGDFASIPSIVISYGNEKTEVVKLLDWNKKDARELNANTINTVLTKLVKEGYSLSASTACSFGSNSATVVTSYTFIKSNR